MGLVILPLALGTENMRCQFAPPPSFPPTTHGKGSSQSSEALPRFPLGHLHHFSPLPVPLPLSLLLPLLSLQVMEQVLPSVLIAHTWDGCPQSSGADNRKEWNSSHQKAIEADG